MAIYTRNGIQVEIVSGDLEKGICSVLLPKTLTKERRVDFVPIYDLIADHGIGEIKDAIETAHPTHGELAEALYGETVLGAPDDCSHL